ncbi:hypothetical protein [Mesorhizobium sp.]|uniref:hypothetical protein n=1 Tax=Mesorhizobium sp. TaxID=1871066 RepID=UPI0025BFA5FB|nr:hypothetical protein [Mesorhizobium sp.]
MASLSKQGVGVGHPPFLGFDAASAEFVDLAFRSIPMKSFSAWPEWISSSAWPERRRRCDLTFQRAGKVGVVGVKPHGRHVNINRKIGGKLPLLASREPAWPSVNPGSRKLLGLPERSPEAEEAQYSYYDDYCSYEPDKIVHGLSPC